MNKRQLRRELDGIIETVESQIANALKYCPHDEVALASLRAQVQAYSRVRVWLDRSAKDGGEVQS